MRILVSIDPVSVMISCIMYPWKYSFSGRSDFCILLLNLNRIAEEEEAKLVANETIFYAPL